jgi:hypothetical protein
VVDRYEVRYRVDGWEFNQGADWEDEEEYGVEREKMGRFELVRLPDLLCSIPPCSPLLITYVPHWMIYALRIHFCLHFPHPPPYAACVV